MRPEKTSWYEIVKESEAKPGVFYKTYPRKIYTYTKTGGFKTLLKNFKSMLGRSKQLASNPPRIQKVDRLAEMYPTYEPGPHSEQCEYRVEWRVYFKNADGTPSDRYSYYTLKVYKPTGNESEEDIVIKLYTEVLEDNKKNGQDKIGEYHISKHKTVVEQTRLANINIERTYSIVDVDDLLKD